MVLTLSRASKTGDEATPQQSLVSRRARSARSSATAGNGRTRSTRSSANPALAPVHGRVSDAEPHQGQVHADVPRRLRSRDPGDDARTRAWRSTGSRHSRARQPRAQIAKAGNIANTTKLARLQRFEPEARAVCTGGEVQLVRAHEPELGERRECERAAEHARQDLHRPRVGEGGGKYAPAVRSRGS